MEEKPSLWTRICTSFNSVLLKAKLFYFFFYASTESLIPYLALYYKHTLLLSPRQIGILLGVRPCCLLISSPLLGTIADKLNRFRAMLLLCLSAYLVTYTVVILVEPVEGFNCATAKSAGNATRSVLNTTLASLHGNKATELAQHRGKREMIDTSALQDPDTQHSKWYAAKFQVKGTMKQSKDRARHKRVVVVKGHYHGKLMNDLYFSWPFSLYDYKVAEIVTWKLFVILLFITVIGELLASPARTFADLYTVQALEGDPTYFGRQLIPGVVGWAIVGTALRLAYHNKVIESQGFCEKGLVLNGKPYFFTFFFLMAACIIIASFFNYSNSERTRPSGLREGCNECKFFNALFKLVSQYRHLAFIVTVALCGVGDGMKSQFLHSYLSDLTGFKTIYPVALVIQFISQVFALAISPILMTKFKQPHLICFGLLFYAITFSVYSFADNGWMVLAVEPLDGFARKLTYVAFVTYVGSPPMVGAALQGVVHGVYIGLGTSVGGFLGALCILKYGYFAVFISLGIAYLIFFGLHLGVLFLFPHQETLGESFHEYEELKEEDEMNEFYSLAERTKNEYTE